MESSSLGLSSKIICPIKEDVIDMKKAVHRMLDYIYSSLVYFGNEKVIRIVEKILNEGTEADNQIDIYKKSGFSGLRKYLVDSVEYNMIKE